MKMTCIPMKTAAAVLLAHHSQSADAVESARRTALLESLSPSGFLWWRALGAELFSPHRVVWLGMGTVWVLIVALHFSTPDAGGFRESAPAGGQDSFALISNAPLLAQLGVKTDAYRFDSR
jgi:hypothetical protein